WRGSPGYSPTRPRCWTGTTACGTVDGRAGDGAPGRPDRYSYRPPRPPPLHSRGTRPGAPLHDGAPAPAGHAPCAGPTRPAPRPPLPRPRRPRGPGPGPPVLDGAPPPAGAPVSAGAAPPAPRGTAPRPGTDRGLTAPLAAPRPAGPGPALPDAEQGRRRGNL